MGHFDYNQETLSADVHVLPRIEESLEARAIKHAGDAGAAVILDSGRILVVQADAMQN